MNRRGICVERRRSRHFTWEERSSD